MKGMWRTTLGLLIAGAVIAVWVFVERKHSDPDDKASDPVELFPFIADEVVRVEVKRAGGAVVVEKKEGRWQITAPRDWPANTERVMQLLARVDPMTKADPFPAKQKPPGADVTGLQAPELEVLLTAGDGRKASISFGKPLGAGEKIFLRRGGKDEILTIAKWLLDAFDVSAESMRDTGFCRFDPKEVEGITYTSAGQDVRLARQGRGWRLTGTLDDLAEPQAAEDWAGALTGLATARFEPRKKPSRADYGLDVPFATLEIRLKSKTIKVAVGAPVEEGSARRWADTSEYPDEIGTVEGAELTMRTPTPEALRAHHPLPWPLGDCDTLVATGAAEFEIHKADSKWSLVKPAILTRFMPDRVDRLLRDLAQATTLLRKPPAEAPAGAIHLVAKWGAVEHAADLWTEGSSTFFRTTDPVRVLETPTTLEWDHASAGALFFRDPLIPTGLVPLQVKQIFIEKNGASWVEAEFVGSKTWKSLKTVEGKDLDSVKMSELCGRWAGMTADTWVRAAKDSPEVGLAAGPVWRIRIVPDPGRASSAAERVFLVGKDGPRNTMYAMLEGEEGVFLVDPNAAGILRAGVWK